MWRRVAQGGVLWFGLTLCVALPPMAQDVGTVQSEVIILDTDRLFFETQFGRRLMQRYEAAQAKLNADNTKTANALEAEERELTAKRNTMTSEAFRALADAFDEKVQKIRNDRERLGRDLERQREVAPINFMNQIKPILADVMGESGAVVILDARTVLLGIEGIDVTDNAIKAIDDAIGDGRQFDRQMNDAGDTAQ